ncbi:2-amino-4-hydroxy-6-hydroxymethyldihydropteridine diphosphokinase [Lachnospiraceae bacterium ZAX-1]
MDQIRIKNLEVYGNHGVFPEENKLGQKFLINATLYTSTHEAGLNDDLTKSIHYGDICHYITKYMIGHTFKLIESAAENLARALLLDTPRLEKIRLEILKPWAPIGLPIESVSVQIERGWHQAYIAFGSNIGDKKLYIEQGIERLSKRKGCQVKKISSFFETAPYGMTEQDNFINGCLELKTILMPMELLRELQKIEKEAGREQTVHWGPRTLDLDIIFYDDIVTEEFNLTIPHIDMHNREFVLQPMSELCPLKHHPVLNKTVLELYTKLKQ